jgi:putative SOS response-associated peptidase YedK
MLPVILNSSPGRIVLSRWGIAPVWLSSVSPLRINVRFETLRDWPTFRSDLALRRCLVLADGFYEWKATKQKRKIPFRITRTDGKPFAFAGIWQESSADSASSPRFSIITTAADSFMAPIHSRMPVILDKDEESEWINAGADVPSLLGMLESPYGFPLRMYEVSREVNRAAVDTPELIKPVSNKDGDAPPLFKAAKI